MRKMLLTKMYNRIKLFC
uniref:Uncharacterized protein n=1 Tax=Anguilla anguilla TaxID=7936 RepID=A0A0E9U8X6_ANGAN